MSEKKVINDFESRETTIITRGETRVYTPLNQSRSQRRHQDQRNKIYRPRLITVQSNKDHEKCKRCQRWFNRSEAEKKGHGGYCRFKCKTRAENKLRRWRQRNKTKQIPAPHRRQLNQLRRQEKKQAPAEFYESDAWRTLRYKVLRKFGFKCMACGARPGPGPNGALHVDHIKPRSKYPQLELDENNLQVLCRDCNKGKSNIYEDDLRAL